MRKRKTMTEPNNAMRRKWAEQTIRFFKNQMGEKKHVCLGVEDAVDLVADILHLTAFGGSDPNAVYGMAKKHFEAEIEEEEKMKTKKGKQ